MNKKNKIPENNTNNKGSRLDQLDKVFPFDIPEGYFDKFPERMEKKISESHPGKERSFSIRTLYQLMPAAALIIIFIVTSIYYLNNSETDSNEFDYSGIASNEYAYLNDADIYESDLFLELIKEEVSDEEMEAYIDDILAEDILLEYYVYEDEEILELIKNF